MTREETLLRRLAAEVTAELASLEQLAQELAGAPSGADTYSLRARGSILHYLRFRHLFRNVYGSGLEADRLQALADRLPATLAAFRERIQEFLSWMLGDGPG